MHKRSDVMYLGAQNTFFWKTPVLLKRPMQHFQERSLLDNVLHARNVIPSYQPDVNVRCNGDSLRAGKSSWQVDYRVSDLQQDGKVALF
jgi:hypothetical protein